MAHENWLNLCDVLKSVNFISAIFGLRINVIRKETLKIRQFFYDIICGLPFWILYIYAMYLSTYSYNFIKSRKRIDEIVEQIYLIIYGFIYLVVVISGIFIRDKLNYIIKKLIVLHIPKYVCLKIKQDNFRQFLDTFLIILILTIVDLYRYYMNNIVNYFLYLTGFFISSIFSAFTIQSISAYMALLKNLFKYLNITVYKNCENTFNFENIVEYNKKMIMLRQISIKINSIFSVHLLSQLFLQFGGCMTCANFVAMANLRDASLMNSVEISSIEWALIALFWIFTIIKIFVATEDEVSI